VLRSATALLAKFISTREPNIKYLGLETLMRLVEVPAVVETIDKWGPCFVLLSHFTSFLLLLTQAWRSSCAWWMCQPWQMMLRNGTSPIPACLYVLFLGQHAAAFLAMPSYSSCRRRH
jgi:hypothetical protein